MEYQIAKGVFDILPKDPDPEGLWKHSHYWQYVESQARILADIYGFREIRTPLFEKTELFQRGVGDGTDIVSKEMYTFLDKGNRSLTLRPEGTASVMRAFIEKHLDQQAPLHKFFYIVPMFRYERQQAGRYRQHHQFGVELVGGHSPYYDVEVMQLLFTFLSQLGLQGLHLQINSIGTHEARQNYKTALKNYLLPRFTKLSKDSQERFETNPLRILDSKDMEDKEVLKEAPSIADYLEDNSKEHFKTICHLLDEAALPYQINFRLVRGLDYYNETVFEVTANELGAQNSLGGGGRYDGLLKKLGGPDLPTLGFGSGIERVIQTMIAQQVFLPNFPKPTLFLIPMGEKAMLSCFNLASSLRKEKVSVEVDYSGKKIKSALRYADLSGATYVAVIGDHELNRGIIELKKMDTKETEQISMTHLCKRLKNG